MPKDPKGRKRPADVIGNAIKVAKIATGEEPEEAEKPDQNPAAELGRRGGRARAEKLSEEERREIARRAAAARWSKRDDSEGG